MRIVVVIFTALLVLGLGAFGVVVAQRATGPAPLMSSSQNTTAAPKAAAATEAGLHVAGATAFRAAAELAQSNTIASASAFAAHAPTPN